MSCQHSRYTKARVCSDGTPGAPVEVRTCTGCGHSWRKYDGELRYPQGVISFSVWALLTPRDERTPAHRAALGLELVSGGLL